MSKNIYKEYLKKQKVRQKYEKRNTAINKEEKEFLNLWEKNILNVA